MFLGKMFMKIKLIFLMRKASELSLSLKALKDFTV